MQSSLRCHQRYSLLPDNYHHRAQVQVYIDQSLPISVKTRCPIRKVIRIANSMLKLNLFQCGLLCWLLRKTPVEERIEELSTMQLDSIQMLNEPYEKQVLLFILLNGYHVKSNFVANGSQIDIDPLILQNVKNFREFYRDWKPEKSVKNVTLNEVNRIFEIWDERKANSSIIKGKIDYNKIVDKILILSKTYNVGGGDDIGSVKETNTLRGQNQQPNKKGQQPNNKKRKPNQAMEAMPRFRYCQQKQVQCQDNLPNNLLASHTGSPMKNSASNKIPWFQDNNNDLMNLGRSQRTLNRSFYNLRSDDANQNMFQSFRSQQSGGMMESLRNTGHNRFFNLNNSYVQINNQSMGGFGMFRSSLDSDVIQLDNNSKKDHNSKKENGVKKSGIGSSNIKQKKKKEMPQLKLKPTVSFDGTK